MIEIGPMPPGGQPAARAGRPPRLTERHVLALGLGISGLFVVAAAAAAVISLSRGGSTWAALHLAMAGAATVAIGAFMPHFAVTLAGTRPAPPAPRLAVLGLLAVGSAAVVHGAPLVGGAAVLVGLAGVAAQTLAPLREPLARRHHVVTAAYGVALAELGAAVALGTAGAAGANAVTDAWMNLRPAHAWLGLFGAVSLTIAATLVYLAPTVLGARIRPSVALGVGIGGIGVGPPLAATGFALASPPLVAVGIGLTTFGGIGLVGYVVDAVRRRGHYTSEHDWRMAAVGHLVAGPAWFAVATAAALGGILAGAQIGGWSLGLLALPLVAGWLLQELVGSWTHLAPAVTPGGPERHARQRRILAAWARTRLAAWNGGLAVAWAALALGALPIGVAAASMVGAAVIGSVILLVRALTVRR